MSEQYKNICIVCGDQIDTTISEFVRVLFQDDVAIHYAHKTCWLESELARLNALLAAYRANVKRLARAVVGEWINQPCDEYIAVAKTDEDIDAAVLAAGGGDE